MKTKGQNIIYINDEKYKKNEVRKIECKNWMEFKEKISVLNYLAEDKIQPSTSPPKTIFRGHSCPDWELSSLLERKFKYNGNNDMLAELNAKSSTNNLYGDIATGIISKFRKLIDGVENVKFDI